MSKWTRTEEWLDKSSTKVSKEYVRSNTCFGLGYEKYFLRWLGRFDEVDQDNSSFF